MNNELKTSDKQRAPNFLLPATSDQRPATSYRRQAVTLIEILIVVVVMAILTAIVLKTAGRIENKSKERLAEGTIAIINAALGQFGEYGYSYKGNFAGQGFAFPLDCTGFDNAAIRQTLIGCGDPNRVVAVPGIDPNDSGIAVMHFFLSRIPECRKVLDKIDKSLVMNMGTITVTFTEGGVVKTADKYPLMRIVDPWKKTLRYDYYEERAATFPKMRDSKRTFPLVTSAGPDGKFDTEDDISSK